MSPISERFKADDYDIMVESSDSTLFRLHKINLQMHSEIFAAAGSVSSEKSEPTSPDVVQLAEDSRTLELLFQYMYPQRQPDLSLVEFEELSGLAEAAEKYLVYAALEICKRHMQDSIPSHPLPVLKYATRHNYRKLVDEAARHTLSYHIENIHDSLDSQFIVPWARYQYAWQEGLKAEYARYTPDQLHYGLTQCDLWISIYATMLGRLGEPNALLNLDTLFSPVTKYPMCGLCHARMKDWHETCVKAVAKLPAMSNFL